MIASLGIVFKICVQKIGKEEDFQDYKHHEKFDPNNQPRLFSPLGHGGKSFFVKSKYFF